MNSICIGIAALVLSLLSIFFAFHCAIVFQKFNDGIKEWSQKLDDSTYDAINRSARKILKELDERFTLEKSYLSGENELDENELDEVY